MFYFSDTQVFFTDISKRMTASHFVMLIVPRIIRNDSEKCRHFRNEHHYEHCSSENREKWKNHTNNDIIIAKKNSVNSIISSNNNK